MIILRNTVLENIFFLNKIRHDDLLLQEDIRNPTSKLQNHSPKIIKTKYYIYLFALTPFSRNIFEAFNKLLFFPF